MTKPDKIKLEIELGNDAMLTGRDVARALRELAKRLADSDLEEETGGCIKDLNGNTVGKWEVW